MLGLTLPIMMFCRQRHQSNFRILQCAHVIRFCIQRFYSFFFKQNHGESHVNIKRLLFIIIYLLVGF